jgi:hypothetical protein
MFTSVSVLVAIMPHHRSITQHNTLVLGIDISGSPYDCRVLPVGVNSILMKFILTKLILKIFIILIQSILMKLLLLLGATDNTTAT